MTLNREQIESIKRSARWNAGFNDGISPRIEPKELMALCDLALSNWRALPLPEGDELSREKILGMWAELESGHALPLAEDLRAVFSLALRAMPPAEGEPRDRKDPRPAGARDDGDTCPSRTNGAPISPSMEDKGPTGHLSHQAPLPEGEAKELVQRMEDRYDFGALSNSAEWRALKSAIERQAAEIARKLAVINEAAEHIRASENSRQKLKARAEAAETSLASARREALEEAFKIADDMAEVNDSAMHIAQAIHDLLASPRQEGT